MSITVELPSLGESVFEGTVSRWLVAEGEMVEVDQPIVEVTTDKVDAEIPAPSAGVIEQILVAEGDVVEVGAVLARIDPDAKAAPASGCGRARRPAARRRGGQSAPRRGRPRRLPRRATLRPQRRSRDAWPKKLRSICVTSKAPALPAA